MQFDIYQELSRLITDDWVYSDGGYANIFVGFVQISRVQSPNPPPLRVALPMIKTERR